MLLIPKHIYTLISTIESELHKKETPSARFYLSDIQDIKRSIAGLSHAEYNHLHLRLMLMHIQKIIKIAKDAHLYAGISEIRRFTNEVLVDERLIHYLNLLNMEDNDLSKSARALSQFISTIPNSLEPELAKCDYKEFRLITTIDTWRKAKSMAGIDVNIAGVKSDKIKIYFVLQKNYHSVYPKKAFEDLKNEYQNNTGCFEQDDFGTLKEAFDTWFHVGDKGIYYVYFG